MDAAFLKSGRIPSLDGLRAIAVGLILAAHSHNTIGFPRNAMLQAIGGYGPVGVYVFFVISGFLITTLILRERFRYGRFDFKEFYWHRCLRILPAYLCLLVVIAALQLTGYANLNASDWVGACTYTVNFQSDPAWEVGHAWSLSVEEHFYLTWPVIMAMPLAGAKQASCIICIVTCLLLRWAILLAFPASTQMAELWTFTRIDTIAFGCLLALLAWNSESRRILDSLNRTSIISCTALILAFSLFVSQVSGKFSVGIAYSVNAACIAVLTWSAIRSESCWIAYLLNSKLLAIVGAMSYSIYLWQQLFLQPNRVGFAFEFPQNLLLTALVATISYQLIERPALRLRDIL